MTPEPPPEAPTAQPPAGWRKVLWYLVVTLVIAPLFWAATAGLGMILVSNSSPYISEFWEKAIVRAVAPLVALLAAHVVARRGLRRGEHNRKGALWTWSLIATGMLTITVFLTVVVQRVKLSSHEKCVLCNLRQISDGADQYYLENGVSSVALPNLVGASNYIKALNTVDNETDPAYSTQGMTITVTGVGGLRTITYAP